MKRKLLSMLAVLMVLAMTMTACGGTGDKEGTEGGAPVTESDKGEANQGDTNQEAGKNEDATQEPETEENKYPQVGTVTYSGEITLKKSQVKVSKLSAFNDVAFKGGETIVGDKSGEGYQALKTTLDEIIAGMRKDGALEKTQSGYIVENDAIILDWDASKEGTEIELRVNAEKKEFYLVITSHFIEGLGEKTATGIEAGGYKDDAVKLFCALMTSDPDALYDTISTNFYGSLSLEDWRECGDVKIKDNDELTDYDNMIIVYTIAAK